MILLHGGLGHGGNWGYQVPALVGAGRRVVLVDSRGHGRSTRDARPYRYELDGGRRIGRDGYARHRARGARGLERRACTALVLAMQAPERVAGVFFFACNMDPSGTREIAFPNPLLDRCLARHTRDYAALSATPDGFKAFFEAVNLMMKTQPNYSAGEDGPDSRARGDRPG